MILILAFLAVIVLSVNGSLKWGWGLPEITATYFPVAILGALLFRMNSSEACVAFGKGVAGVAAPTLVIVYAFVTGFNFFVSSGSGKAVVMMPILSPLGQVLGINQQVMVLAYQCGDGFTNTFWPTSSLLQLSLRGMDYGHWFKFEWKIYACLITAGFILIVIANQIGYGPF